MTLVINWKVSYAIDNLKLGYKRKAGNEDDECKIIYMDICGEQQKMYSNTKIQNFKLYMLP